MESQRNAVHGTYLEKTVNDDLEKGVGGGESTECWQ